MQLSQYGAVGVLLAALMGLFLWVFKALFTRFLTHMDAFQEFMKQQVLAMEGLNRRISDNHDLIMRRLEDMTPNPTPTRNIRVGR